MIVERLDIDRSLFERTTGWVLKPEGACKGDVCVPLSPTATDGDVVHIEAVADRLGMPLVHEGRRDLWALGPAGVTGRPLPTATKGTG